MIKGKISEIFTSVQGEGIFVGEKQIFVRLFGCNLSCKFCDTKTTGFFEYTPGQLAERLKQYKDKYHSVSFTGGEPLLQKDFLKEALKVTKKAGFKNYLETNGTLPDELKEVIDYLDIVAMDLKLSTSTGMADFLEEHLRFLKIASQKEVFLKVVICNSTEEDDFENGIKALKKFGKPVTLVLQPNTNEKNKNNRHLDRKLERFREICNKNNITTCVIPQMHKVVGVI